MINDESNSAFTEHLLLEYNIPEDGGGVLSPAVHESC